MLLLLLEVPPSCAISIYWHSSLSLSTRLESSISLMAATGDAAPNVAVSGPVATVASVAAAVVVAITVVVVVVAVAAAFKSVSVIVVVIIVSVSSVSSSLLLAVVVAVVAAVVVVVVPAAVVVAGAAAAVVADVAAAAAALLPRRLLLLLQPLSWYIYKQPSFNGFFTVFFCVFSADWPWLFSQCVRCERLESVSSAFSERFFASNGRLFLLILLLLFFNLTISCVLNAVFMRFTSDLLAL